MKTNLEWLPNAQCTDITITDTYAPNKKEEFPKEGIQEAFADAAMMLDLVLSEPHKATWEVELMEPEDPTTDEEWTRNDDNMLVLVSSFGNTDTTILDIDVLDTIEETQKEGTYKYETAYRHVHANKMDSSEMKHTSQETHNFMKLIFLPQEKIKNDTSLLFTMRYTLQVCGFQKDPTIFIL